MQEIGSSIQSVGNASFDRVEQPVAQTEEVDSTEETESGDTVEITITEIPPDESTPSGTAIGTYGPRAVGDRFKYDIQNGMLDGSLRFSALNKPFNISADATYSARGSIGTQLSLISGAHAALFSIQHNDSQPDSASASSNVDAKTEQNRIIDQNFSMGSTLTIPSVAGTRNSTIHPFTSLPIT